MFRGSVKSTGYPLQSPFSPSLPSRASPCTITFQLDSSNVGYTMFRVSVKSTGYPLHSTVSPSLPLPYVTVCRHISTGLYHVTVGYVLTVPNFPRCLPCFSLCLSPKSQCPSHYQCCLASFYQMRIPGHKLCHLFFSPGVTTPFGGCIFAALYRALASSLTRFLDHKQRRATVGRTPLNE